MIKRNQRLLNILNMFLDAFIIAASYAFAAWLWLDLLGGDTGNYASLHSLGGKSVLAGFLYTFMMLFILALLGVYNTTRVVRLKREALSIVGASLIGALVLGSALFLFRLEDFSRGVLALFTITSAVLLIIKRMILRSILSYLRERGYNQKHVYVVGTGRLARQYAQSLQAEKQLGFSIAGFFGQAPQEGDLRVLGGFADLDAALEGSDVDEVIIAIEAGETEWITSVISLCEKHGTKVGIIPFYNDIIPNHPTIDIIGNTKLINLRSNPLENIGNALIKRLGDLLIGGILLIALSPLLLLLSVLVKLSSPGPVLFKQRRVGRNKRPFMMLKFRSMRVNDRENSGWTTDADPRRTRLGSFLRKLSLDELPQLVNVIRGDMSLVGPRPEVPFYVDKFKEEVPLYMVKHQVRPGITGWAQVHGYRGNTSIVKRIEHDIWYIENWSIGLDLKILFLTLFGGWMNKESVRASRGESM